MFWGLLCFWFCYGFFCARISLKHSRADIEAKTFCLIGRILKPSRPSLSGLTLSKQRGIFFPKYSHVNAHYELDTSRQPYSRRFPFSSEAQSAGLQDLDKTLPTDKAQTLNLLSTSQSLTPYRKSFGIQ